MAGSPCSSHLVFVLDEFPAFRARNPCCNINPGLMLRMEFDTSFTLWPAQAVTFSASLSVMCHDGTHARDTVLEQCREQANCNSQHTHTLLKRNPKRTHPEMDICWEGLLQDTKQKGLLSSEGSQASTVTSHATAMSQDLQEQNQVCNCKHNSPPSQQLPL